MSDSTGIHNNKNKKRYLSAQERIEELLKSENIIPERPPSLDANGHRLNIIPATVRGKFRRYRTACYLFLVFIFLVLPWTRFSGQQTVHLNLSKMQFVFFGKTLFAHDGPYLFLIFGLIVFGLALATSWYGRVWCGWACPQTVFIDIIYRKLEEWIEGNHLQRRKLQSRPWDQSKIIKKSIKWLLYALISIHVAHSFFAYFVGARELLSITLGSPLERIGLFTSVYVVSVLTLINFGWFREQFCLVACPYGRLQAALMDEKSITVFYDPLRGEPRRQNQKRNEGAKIYGDCVNCLKCVSVCPTGIDIRNGIQLECIACTACVDACDEVMDKLKKPRGLIRYASEREINSGKVLSHRMGARSKIYAAVVSFLTLVLIASLFIREEISIKVLRANGAPYQVADSNGEKQVVNHFRFHITNQVGKDISIEALNFDDADLEVVSPNANSLIPANDNLWIHVFVKFKTPGPLIQGRATTSWTIMYNVREGELKNRQKVIRGSLNLIGPE